MPKKIQIFDIPTSAGCLELGTELLGEHFRKQGLVAKLEARGFEVSDLGAPSVPNVPRHNSPPIRNYPLSKIVWSKTRDFVKNKIISGSENFALCLGGDCSIVVGTALGIGQLEGIERVHLLYLDGDVDSVAPDQRKCVGSAGMGLWFLTQESEYWEGPRLSHSQITVIGNKKNPETDLGIRFITLDKLRLNGIQESIAQVLASIPKDAALFIHLDVDILSGDEMPAAYAPREEGLLFDDIEILLRAALKDKRARFLEVSELVPHKDPDGVLAKKIIETVVRCI